MTMTGDANPMARPATPPEPTVLAAWTGTLVRALDARGLDGAAMARWVGIDPVALEVDAYGRVPLARTTALWERAIEATGDDSFGIEVSRFVRPTTFRGLSLGIVASGTFRDALDRSVRFAHIVLSEGPLRTEGCEVDGHYRFTSTVVPGQPVPDPAAQEAILATIVRSARFLLGPGVGPDEVWLERSRPARAARFESFFGCPVHFGADHHGLSFDVATVDRRVRTGCDDLARTADALTVGHLERVEGAATTTARVRAALVALGTDDAVSAGEVAARLAMSSRSLQRHLREEGTTFREVVAGERIARAKHLIATEGLGAAQLAARLGYSDAAAFRRAFKRRTGTTAGAFAAGVATARPSPGGQRPPGAAR